MCVQLMGILSVQLPGKVHGCGAAAALHSSPQRRAREGVRNEESEPVAAQCGQHCCCIPTPRSCIWFGCPQAHAAALGKLKGCL